MANGVSQRALISIYDFIYRYTEIHKYTPTMREIKEGTYYKSTCTVKYALDELYKEGKIETDHGLGSPRAYRVTELARRWENA